MNLACEESIEPAGLRVADSAAGIAPGTRRGYRRRARENADVKALLIERQLTNVRKETTFAPRETFEDDRASCAPQKRLGYRVAERRVRRRCLTRIHRPDHGVGEIGYDRGARRKLTRSAAVEGRNLQ